MTAPPNGLSRLRASSSAAPEPRAQEVCEFCSVAMGERHGHVADTTDHRLLCVCRPCYLLFAPEGAGGGRFRAVGEEVRRVDLDLNAAQWDALRVPVDLVFLLAQTGAERPVAFYPGPGGATESELELAAWTGIAEANPQVAEAAVDVEAVLVRRHDDGWSCFIVPVDLCYELVGVVRLWWTGLAGGPEVWQRIDAFFDDLAAHAR